MDHTALTVLDRLCAANVATLSPACCAREPDGQRKEDRPLNYTRLV